MNISWLTDNPLAFPAVEQALEEPNGLLAAGGDLSSARLIAAYKQGIFPWYDADQPILWWSPDPRTVLQPDQIHCSKSLKKALKKSPWRYSFDQQFEQVIHHCGTIREHNDGTWITAEMHDAYVALHRLGYAHSVEIWDDKELVGGLYGIAIGSAFFGESMFSLKTNASKMALLALGHNLHQCGYQLIDCQVDSDHLFSLGAALMARKEFTARLNTLIDSQLTHQPWEDTGTRPVSSLVLGA